MTLPAQIRREVAAGEEAHDFDAALPWSSFVAAQREVVARTDATIVRGDDHERLLPQARDVDRRRDVADPRVDRPKHVAERVRLPERIRLRVVRDPLPGRRVDIGRVDALEHQMHPQALVRRRVFGMVGQDLDRARRVEVCGVKDLVVDGGAGGVVVPEVEGAALVHRCRAVLPFAACVSVPTPV